MNDKITLETIPDETQLAALYEFDKSAYGDAGISWDTFLSWWRSFPKGLLGIWKGEQIVGAVGMWPMSEAGYADILNARVREQDIDPLVHFDPHGGPHARWYVSGIVVRPEHQRTGVVSTLVFAGFDHLGQLAQKESIDICAIATSVQGQRLLLRFGFSPRGRTEEGYEVYELPGFSVEEFG